MQFKNIIGQAGAKQKIWQSISENRLAHAIMLLGPEGNGGLSMALALAQMILCENPSSTDSCGVCSQCTKSQKMIHPDIHYMFPNIKRTTNDKEQLSKEWIKEWREMIGQQPYINSIDWINSLSSGENKQGNITIGDCHQVIKNLSLMAYEGKYKIQLIWLAEYLAGASNALLKIIEEPPQDTIFILVVENIELILSTIISRTQLIKVPAVADIDLQNGLVDQFGVSAEDARKISRVADGNYYLAMKMADGEENTNDVLTLDLFKACMRKALRNDVESMQNMQQVVSRFAELGREKQKNFVKYALFFTRETMMLSNGLPSKLEGEEIVYAQRFVSYLSIEKLEKIAVFLNKLHYYIERNANPKSQMTAFCIRMSNIIAEKEVEMVSY
jgi:DNA polymerase III subunit delta'